MDPVVLAEYQRSLDLIAQGQLEMCSIWFPASLAVLLVCYLEIGGFSTFIILIPLFLVIGACTTNITYHISISYERTLL